MARFSPRRISSFEPRAELTMRPAENKLGPSLGTTSREENKHHESDSKAAAHPSPTIDPCVELAALPGGAERFRDAAEILCHWFVMPPGQRGLSAKAIGQRVIMAMWIMRPDIIGNLSMTEIGALVDARPEVLSRQATAFSKRFGIRGRAQFSEKTRKAQSESAKQRHARETLEKGVPSGLN